MQSSVSWEAAAVGVVVAAVALGVRAWNTRARRRALKRERDEMATREIADAVHRASAKELVDYFRGNIRNVPESLRPILQAGYADAFKTSVKLALRDRAGVTELPELVAYALN